MSYNFIQKSGKNVQSITEKDNLEKIKQIVDTAFKEIKYKPSEIKILIIGMNDVGKKIYEEVIKKCQNVYYTSENKLEGMNNEINKAIDPKHLREEICKMDIVFVTENKPIINKNMLILMSTETVIIDVTKENNSIDIESAKKLNIKVIRIE